MRNESLDRGGPTGRLHPATRAARAAAGALDRLGFERFDGPCVEKTLFNFDALAIAPEHPERDPGSSLGVAGLSGRVLRTHTTAILPRALRARRLPLRVYTVGRVFRPEAVDASHATVFTQLEAFVVERRAGAADLLGLVHLLADALFGPGRPLRSRVAHFPFTAPSWEFESRCPLPRGRSCRLCLGSGWVELLGCGLVRPEVLSASGVDPELWSGYALGLGVERAAMLREGIDDLGDLDRLPGPETSAPSSQ